MAKTDQPGAGMEKAELRTHVKFARRKPVHIAFALGGDGKAVLMMDKRKPARAIVRDLKEQAAESRNHRFGSMMFDPENPKLAIITVNKASTGMARKLMIALKGTGVRQIQIMTEDGEAIETAQNDDEEDEEDDNDQEDEGHDGRDDEGGTSQAADHIADAVSHTASDVTDTLARFFGDRDGSDRAELSIKARYEGTPSQAEADVSDGEQAESDAKALTAELVGLVKRMMDAIKQDPAQKAGLAELATDAQASLKRGDLAQAAAGIEVFRLALDGMASSAADSVAVEEDPRPSVGDDAHADGEGDQLAEGEPPASDVGAKAVQRYRKSRAVWVATRAKIDADIKKLSDTILALDHGGALGDDLEQNFLNTIDPILSTLDDSLADILTAAETATSADETTRALDQARTTIGLYQNFVQSDATIKELDQNPFMPMAIAKTLNASLQVLSAAMK